ncbi:unnamed protein product [Protopolystoma xenopodis]|uniref:Uncharacterized protein n=1 Tax=Protopolystoma xenopodis TaxID=117903 RepID=A0A448WRB6_9PLAT|nr:unnamed protein product [Protopolystoma xenopodis]
MRAVGPVPRLASFESQSALLPRHDNTKLASNTTWRRGVETGIRRLRLPDTAYRAIRLRGVSKSQSLGLPTEHTQDKPIYARNRGDYNNTDRLLLLRRVCLCLVELCFFVTRAKVATDNHKRVGFIRPWGSFWPQSTMPRQLLFVYLNIIIKRALPNVFMRCPPVARFCPLPFSPLFHSLRPPLPLASPGPLTCSRADFFFLSHAPSLPLPTSLPVSYSLSLSLSLTEYILKLQADKQAECCIVQADFQTCPNNMPPSMYGVDEYS